MNSLIQFVSWKNRKNKTVKHSLRSWLVAVGVALFTPCVSLSSAWGAFPFVDNNDNGVYDAGDSGDITAQILDDGIFSTPSSLVIPAGVSLSTSKPGGLILAAGKNITVVGNLTASATTGNIQLIAKDGSIEIGSKAALKAGNMFLGTAKHDIVVGSYAQLQATAPKGLGYVLLTAENNISLMDHVVLSGVLDVRLMAGYDSQSKVVGEGNVTVLQGSELGRGGQYATIFAAGDVMVNGSKMTATTVRVATEAHLVDFRSNTVTTSATGGLVVLTAKGSTIDIRNTTFKNVKPENLIIQAPTVIQ